MILQSDLSAVLSMCRNNGIEATVNYVTYYYEYTRKVKAVYYDIWECSTNVAPMEYIKRK